MTEVTVRDPSMVVQKNVKDDGRIYLGTDLKGKRVEIVVSEIEQDEPEATEE